MSCLMLKFNKNVSCLFALNGGSMKKLVALLSVLMLLCLAAHSWAAPAPPVMSIDTSGTSIVISWSTVDDATGYRLYYAPYPFVGEETIGNIDMLEETATSILLWEGAAYYLTVTAYDSDQNESSYSNIEYFIMGPPTPEWVDNDTDGFTEVDGDCNDTDLAINPSAEDICGDGIDQDCSGADLTCPILLGPPELTYAVSGLNVILSWTKVTGATGYKLYYAPSPYTGPEDFSSVDVANETSVSFTLWQGAAYHIAVTAYDADGESVISGIENFVVDAPNPENVDDDSDGYTENQGDCDDTQSSINPDATEICGDNIDQDCDGSDVICPTIDPGYTDNGDGTVIDNTTGLIWQQSHDDVYMNRNNAIYYCDNLSLGGSSIWRLPSIEELETLYNPKYSPPIYPLFDEGEIGGTRKVFLSSTLFEVSIGGQIYNQYFLYNKDGSIVEVHGGYEIPQATGSAKCVR